MVRNVQARIGKTLLACCVVLFAPASWAGSPTDPLFPMQTPRYLLYRCDPAIPKSCGFWHEFSTNTQIGPVAFGNGRIYVATKNTSDKNNNIYSCDPNAEFSCIYLDYAGDNEIKAMVYANNRLYAGLGNGVLWNCDPNTADSCSTFDNAGGQSINALAYGNGRLYAGLNNGILWSCNANAANACATLDKAGGPIDALTYGNNRLYAGIHDSKGTLWSCNPGNANQCSNLDAAGSSTRYNAMIYANSRVYAALMNYDANSTLVWNCDPDNANRCSTIYSESNYNNGSGEGLFGLQYKNDRLFFQSATQSLMSCSPNNSTDCSRFDALNY